MDLLGGTCLHNLDDWSPHCGDISDPHSASDGPMCKLEFGVFGHFACELEKVGGMWVGRGNGETL